MSDKDIHTCSQGSTLEQICRQQIAILDEIKEIKKDQKEYLEKVNAIEIEIASRPTAVEQKETMKKVQAHDIYFGIMAFTIGCLITLMIAVGSGFLQRALGVG